MKQKFRPKKTFSLLASLHLTAIALVVLMILVIWGTLYEVDHGIYAAQDRFFKAWFVFIAGIIPFPAVKTVISVLTVNLIAAAFKKRPINSKTIGIIILHVGVIVLVGGSAITSFYVEESAISLTKNQSTDKTYDFATWKLIITVRGQRHGAPFTKIQRYKIKKLKAGKNITLEPTDASLHIKQIHQNCSAKMSGDDNRSIIGLKPLEPSTERGRNYPGMVFSIASEKTDPPPTLPDLFVYAGSPFVHPFIVGTDTVTISMQPHAISLPMRIRLTDFRVQWHPGTSNAKSYQSRLRLFGKNMDREVVIEMNRPFRYKSFSFYQMGYSGEEGNYSSTLAIVKNPFRYLPYVASIIIVIGLILHLIVKMWYEISATRGSHRDN